MYMHLQGGSRWSYISPTMFSALLLTFYLSLVVSPHALMNEVSSFQTLLLLCTEKHRSQWIRKSLQWDTRTSKGSDMTTHAQQWTAMKIKAFLRLCGKNTLVVSCSIFIREQLLWLPFLPFAANSSKKKQKNTVPCYLKKIPYGKQWCL